MAVGSPTTEGALWPVHAAAAVFGLAYGLSAPLISLALHARGFTESLIGANAAMYALGVLAVAPQLPKASRRWGNWPLLVAGLVIVALVLPAFWVLPWIGAWFALRLLLGAGSEAVMVLTETWVSAASSNASRSTSIALYTASLSAGFALGPALLSVLGSDTWAAYALGGLLPLLALGVLLGGRARPARAPEQRHSRALMTLVASAPFAMAGTALNAALESAGLSLLPIYAVQQGWSASSATLLISTLMLGAIVLQLPIGWLGDRFRRRRLVLILTVLSTLGACLWPFAIHQPGLAYPLLFVWGGCFVGIYTLIVTEVGTQYQGSELVALYGAMSIAWGVGALLGPALAGLALEVSHHGLAWFAAACCGAFALAQAPALGRSNRPPNLP